MVAFIFIPFLNIDIVLRFVLLLSKLISIFNYYDKERLKTA